MYFFEKIMLTNFIIFHFCVEFLIKNNVPTMFLVNSDFKYAQKPLNKAKGGQIKLSVSVEEFLA